MLTQLTRRRCSGRPLRARFQTPVLRDESSPVCPLPPAQGVPCGSSVCRAGPPRVCRTEPCGPGPHHPGLSVSCVLWGHLLVGRSGTSLPGILHGLSQERVSWFLLTRLAVRRPGPEWASWRASFIYFLKVYLLIFEIEHRLGRGRERGRHRIRSRLQAPSCQHRARRGARTHEL